MNELAAAPDGSDAMAERLRAGRELGNAVPDTWLPAGAPGGVELADSLLRGADDVRATLGQCEGDGVLCVYSGRLRHDLLVARLGDTVQAWLMNGAGRSRRVALDDAELAPVWLDSRQRFAAAWFERERDRALAASREAWQADPTNPRAGMEHGELLARAGELPEALVVWQELHTAHPHFAPPLLRLADAMLELGVMNEDQQALRIADATSELARQRFADNAAAHAARGRFLWATSQAGAARDCFAQALAIDPTNAVAHYHVGLIAAASRDHETAIASFRACLATDPDDAEAGERLAESLAAVGRGPTPR